MATSAQVHKEKQKVHVPSVFLNYSNLYFLNAGLCVKEVSSMLHSLRQMFQRVQTIGLLWFCVHFPINLEFVGSSPPAPRMYTERRPSS